MKTIMIVAAAILALTATAHAAGPSRAASGFTTSASGKTVFTGR
ncbi:MAG TPA: hypothetical protein VN155_10300 [Devosia sp.]|nr:hypothetical protein [Devosia sp.]